MFAKSAKQKIVIKSSTKFKPVGLSDTASQALNLLNLINQRGRNVRAYSLIGSKLYSYLLLTKQLRTRDLNNSMQSGQSH